MAHELVTLKNVRQNFYFKISSIDLLFSSQTYPKLTIILSFCVAHLYCMLMYSMFM